jgi:ribosomal-protein-alanine N-acetyltransferase
MMVRLFGASSMTKNPATLHGAKVYLRHPRASDLAELSELYAVSRNHLRGLASTEFGPAQFERMMTDAEMESNEYFLICAADTQAIAGTINLSQIFRKSFQNAYLGYMLGAGHTGRGYMSDAVSIVLRFAFADLKLHRIEANVQPSNLPSIRVLERNGFTKEGFSKRYLKIGGRWRDHERWAIIAEDWKKRK